MAAAVQNYTGENLPAKSWFHASLSREGAESLVKEHGELGNFVVRNSSRANNFALTYLNKHGKITHSLISQDDEGFRLPDDKRGRVFPTLGALLRTCRFLKWDENDIDDRALAQLGEMFPEEDSEQLTKVLIRARNDVDTAIEFLLARQTSTSVAIGARETRGGAGRHQDASNSDRAVADEPVCAAFLKTSRFQVDAREVPENWRQLEGKVTRGLSKTLEGNLQKILSSRDHPMGKKVSMFSMAFNASYSSPASGVAASLQAREALSELSEFFKMMRESVAGKVTELNTTAGALMVWRAVEACTLALCYDTLYEVLRAKEVDRDAAIPWDVLRSTPVHSTVDACAVAVGISGVAARSTRARLLDDEDVQAATDTLAGLPSLRTATHKLEALKSTVHQLDDAVKRKAGGAGASASALLPLMVAALARSYIQSPHAEVALLRELIPSSIACGQEGFALSVFSAAAETAARVGEKCRTLPGAGRAQLAPAASEPDFEVPPSYEDSVGTEPDMGFNPRGLPAQNPAFGAAGGAAMNPPASNPFVAPGVNTNFQQIPVAAAPANDTQQRAEQRFIETLHMMTDSVDAQIQLSAHYYGQGDVAQAIAYAERALELDPNNATAAANLSHWRGY
jgi:tetratricopeptide (TPR) repeat protein